MGAVIVVGSVNVDLVVAVATLPAPGETVTGGTFARHGGGKGANQAVAAARAGADVRLVGAVGADDLGREALQELRTAGVDVSCVDVLDGETTGVALIAVDADGENQIAVASGANGSVDGSAAGGAIGAAADSGGDGEAGSGVGAAGLPGHDAPGAPDRAGRGVVLLGHEVPDAAVLAGARAAADAGWTAVLNPAPAREVPAAVLALGPILTPNRSEAVVLAGSDDPEQAARILGERTGAAVVITLGGDGVLLLAPGAEPERLPAPAVEVVDTTGAGDAFNGALAAALADGAPLRAACEAAIAVAADAVTRGGAR